MKSAVEVGLKSAVEVGLKSAFAVLAPSESPCVTPLAPALVGFLVLSVSLSDDDNLLLGTTVDVEGILVKNLASDKAVLKGGDIVIKWECNALLGDPISVELLLDKS